MTKLRRVGLYLIAVLAITVFCLVIYGFEQTSELGFKIAFLDVGQGDAIYIQAPNGRQMVIDGGPRGSLVKALKPQMPPGDTSIDVILVTHPDTDHYAGFVELLDTYTVGTVIESGKTSTAKTYQEFQSLISEHQIPKVIGRKGTRVVLDQEQGVVFTILFPIGDVTKLATNDASIVGRLVYGDASVMLTGDAPIKTESQIISANPPEAIKSTILKLGHHGSKTSTSNAFIRAVDPLYAIVSAGKNNRYGHPDIGVVDRVEGSNVEIVSTQTKGTITFYSDGAEIFMSDK